MLNTGVLIGLRAVTGQFPTYLSAADLVYSYDASDDECGDLCDVAELRNMQQRPGRNAATSLYTSPSGSHDLQVLCTSRRAT